MKETYSVSLYIDTRRKKSNGLYPIRISVYDKILKKKKLYSTDFDIKSEKELSRLRGLEKKTKEIKKFVDSINELIKDAETIAESLTVFTFEAFERKYLTKKDDNIRIQYLYQKEIEQLNKYKQISNSSIFELAAKSFKEFSETKNSKKFEKLTLFDISASWLRDYELFMVEDKGRSLTTVSIYTRSLRKIFNAAIKHEDIPKEYYPFGEDKYQVAAVKKVKKALTRQQIKDFYDTVPKIAEQQKAKDYWFFSFNCNGMNINDIARLKFKDLEETRFSFYRGKTLTTSRKEITPIIVYYNDFIRQFIDKYSNDDKSPNNYVFPILEHGMTAKQEKDKIKNFTRFVNQHIKKLCSENGINAEISTYWARHSFVTLSVLKGASKAFIQESVGHSDIRTTEAYFNGFDSETKAEFAADLMNF